MSDDRLVRMANQIAAAFTARTEAEAVAATEEHIRLYWEPRMRTALSAHLDAGGAGLTPVARAAAVRLRGDR
ncbi:MAG: formate dehydrogenase subunit delta [Rhodospirillales bacterium]